MPLYKGILVVVITAALGTSLIACKDSSSSGNPASEQAPSADEVIASAKSKQIAEAVRALAPLALSGVEEFTITKRSTTKDALLQVATKKQLDPDFDAEWTTDSSLLWEVDSVWWGETDEATAKNYLFNTVKEDDFYSDDESEAETQWNAYQAKLPTGKIAFDKLKNTGVTFGVGPLGALQCSVRFPALVIVDPSGGKAYRFAVEPSGDC